MKASRRCGNGTSQTISPETHRTKFRNGYFPTTSYSHLHCLPKHNTTLPFHDACVAALAHLGERQTEVHFSLNSHLCGIWRYCVRSTEAARK
ncbi:hypothetical protein B0J12DRAFT_287673 [Macrophomina phaseolina]|uniref:Uncharacterized protein n=1 Tax=Macrophomina phaseolina TaxID=35725 RepID=A0ABQ8GNC4_9PEZI|nr:hypothetical protein B0J12DRAFT_287673 [Macrophomina phaseolina]